MNTQHTPGPWNCAGAYGHHGIAIEGPNGEALGHVRAFIPNGDVAHGMPVMTPWAEGQANARLIAAAPELLEACQTFAEWLRREEAGFPAETRFNTPEGEAKWREWFDENLRICDLAQKQARAAIAKAAGGEA